MRQTPIIRTRTVPEQKFELWKVRISEGSKNLFFYEFSGDRASK